MSLFCMSLFRRYRSCLLNFLVVFCLLAASVVPVSAASDLLFTQYVEGSSFNKAIEIANSTGGTVDLSAYTLELYSNGAASPSQSVSLIGSLADGDVYVVAHASADAAILAVANQISSVVANWNGDDAIVLQGASGVVDSLGQVGVDPGLSWSGSGVSTRDATLCRNDDVTQGDTNVLDAFDPSVEWFDIGNDTFTGLGVIGCEATPEGDLLFTQYVEGSSFNKAIEIANLTASSVDLSVYTLELYTNGSASVSQSLALTGSLAPGAVFVAAHGSAAPAILLVADLVSSTVVNWNGDDAVVLRRDGLVVDVIGQVGVDPGSAWVGGSVSTANDTLCRNGDITSGDTVETDAFDPSAEWFAIGNDVFTGLGAIGCNAAPEGDLLFTQYVEGSSSNKAIEIANFTGTSIDLSAYKLELYSNGNVSPNSTQVLSGTLADGAVYVLANGSAAQAILDVTDLVSSTVNWNGDDAVVLRNGEVVIDVIGQVGFDPGSQWEVGGVGTQNDTLCRNDDISSGDSDETDAFDPSAEWFAIGNDVFTGLGEVGCQGDPGGDPVPYFIHDVQGNGPTVAVTGPVIVEGIVTALYESNDATSSFFLQEEDTDVDADPQTSEGIFVFCGACPTAVTVGDRASVIGMAEEYFGMSQVDANDGGSVTVLSSGNPLPTATVLDLPASGSTSAEATFEAIEGMLVTFQDKLVVSEYFQLARFGEVVLTEGSRPYQFTHLSAPSPAGLIAFQNELETRRIILDDNTDNQNEATSGPAADEPYAYPSGGLSNSNRFRGGDSITGLTGVLHWSWAGANGTDAWRVRPIPQLYDYTFVPENPRPAEPAFVGGSLRVASVNVLNYFTTLDEPGAVCGPSAIDCRGANSAAELARQRAKTVAELLGLDADVFGLVELENDGDDATLADLVAGLNDATSPGSYDSINTGSIGGDAIKVGLIYRTATVIPVGPYAVLDSSVDPTFLDTRNRPALIQTFEEAATGERFTVAVNHLKSKGSGCDSDGDPDLNDGQGSCPLTRTAAAIALANYLTTDPTGSGDPDFLIIGDLNSYAMEDPILALQLAGYTDLIDLFGGVEAYSYVFDGQLGYLDYALASSSLLAQVTGVAEWAINADEPALFDYNDDVQDASEATFDRESSALPLYEANAYRSSDHDPVVVGLDLVPTCFGERATIVGTEGNDRINGTQGRDVIVGLGGDDRINGLSGDDLICAGDGDDQVNGNNGDDVIDGGAGFDRLNGNGGVDTCISGEAVSSCEN